MTIAKYLTNLLIWLAALIALIFYISLASGSASKNNLLQDFHVFYVSAVHAREHKKPYVAIYEPESEWATGSDSKVKQVGKTRTIASEKNKNKKQEYRVGVNLNPPFFTLLMNPISHVPYIRAYFIWILLAVLMIYASLRMVISVDKKFRSESRYVGMAFFLLLIFPPTLMNAACGQLGALFTFGLVSAWLLGKKNHPYLMAIVLAALASIKLFVAFYVFMFLVKKQYRLTSVFILSALVFTFLPLLMGFTVANYIDFVKTIVNLHWVSRLNFSNWNVSLVSPFARINALLLPHASHKMKLLAKFPYYVLLAGVLWGYIYRLRSMDVKQHFDLIFVLTFVVMFLVCPLSWSYYLMSFVLIIFILIKRAIVNEHCQRYLLLIAVGLFFSSIYYPFATQGASLSTASNLAAVVRGSLPFFGFAIISFVAYQLSSPKALSARPATISEKNLRFSLMSGFLLALIPSLYTMNHMMKTAITFFLFYR